MDDETPYQVQAVRDLQENYSAEHFQYAVNECQKVIALLIADDKSSNQQIARVNILRYLNLQLTRASRWADDEADLLAIVLRSEIELRNWADFVSLGGTEAAQFLREVNVDIRELHQKMRVAFLGIRDLPDALPDGKRIQLDRVENQEEYDFKLCSKLIHPSALVLNHPEDTIAHASHKAYIAVRIVVYAWSIIERFHDIVWT